MTKTFKQALLGAVAALALGSFAGPAHADLVTFTWDPSAVGGTGPNVTANNMNLADFAVAKIASSGSFTEQGYLNVTSFLQGATNVTPTQLGGLNGTYQIYYQFSASGQINGWNAANPTGNYNGSITGLNYSLLLDPNYSHPAGAATTQFSVSASGATATGTADDVTLATGSLMGTGDVTLTNGVPGADANATITPDPVAAALGFFVAPPPANYITLQLEASFTNTRSVSTVVPGNPTILEINGGGGNADLATIPEPATLSLFGTALVGLGFAVKRRRKS